MQDLKILSSFSLLVLLFLRLLHLFLPAVLLVSLYDVPILSCSFSISPFSVIMQFYSPPFVILFRRAVHVVQSSLLSQFICQRKTCFVFSICNLTFLSVLTNVMIFKKITFSSYKKFPYLNNIINIYRTGSKKQNFKF